MQLNGMNPNGRIQNGRILDMLLLAKAHELRHGLVDWTSIPVENDPGPHTHRANHDDAVVSHDERETRLMREVEGALEHIGEGECGFCTLCGEELPGSHFSAAPWARQCAACQSRRRNGYGFPRAA